MRTSYGWLLALATQCGTAVLAHGGAYRGPTELIPSSSSSSSGGSSTTNSGPNSAGTSGTGSSTAGASTAGPATPAGLGAKGPIRRGMLVAGDPTRWIYWWEFHKDSILHVREAIDRSDLAPGADDFLLGTGKGHELRSRLRPTRDEVRKLVVPALQQALAKSEGRDLTSACLVALAKIGEDDKDCPTLPLLRAKLTSADQEIRETAALALGITRRPEALTDLLGLVSDDADGRQLVGRAQVDERTRAFAAYAAGLVGEVSTPHKRMVITSVLAPILARGSASGRELPVAVVHALRLCIPKGPRSEDGGAEAALRKDIVTALRAYQEQDLGPGEQALQAHALLALAQALGSGASAEHEKLKEFCIQALAGTGTRRSMPATLGSATLALGRLYVKGNDDDTVGKALFACMNDGKPIASRRFATMALALAGGDATTKRFVEMLAGDADHLSRPWLALGLGMIARANRLEGKPIPAAIAQTLRQELGKAKDPEYLGALAISLGLAKDHASAGDLLAILKDRAQENELVGYLCTALALLQAPDAEAEIQATLERSVRRPEVMAKAAIALGKLGDKKVTDRLIAHLLECEGEGSLARLGALAQALGLVGDRRSLDPLVSMLLDKSRPPLARAFAAVALGNVCDEHDLPWNATIAQGINYLAPVDTLYDQVAGVLDIF